ncbi:hypothetical protein BO83DRAFT_156983 [Aspergillus eucalypticola CBS 122712]|uniref:Helicase C-terminal domain-containing protein n=1 Tax=Aspergillus eucalypticola (strain CBS 122712 / IBT 29274) TaxID=1448314 RepID=A0A317USB0_ASPEC|nr:uncharacterized protein BO83DRAFT_156983 [Aspergillus eucalypticola CBS 122712]PWY63457.1 hypothetical protein BO83DRAFT_156983 [Aspergillus eucalypticola CBS 122712]
MGFLSDNTVTLGWGKVLREHPVPTVASRTLPWGVFLNLTESRDYNNKHHNHVQLVQKTRANTTIFSLCYHFCIGKPCKVGIYIGTTGTSSRGLTLTRAAHLILMETDWCSTNHKQVFGRCHRIGQRASRVRICLPKYPN